MATATQPRQLSALLVAHAQLVPSLTNPRKRFDKDRLEELALSMAPPVGILEPLVVRRLAVDRAKELGLNPPDQFFEIIAGERRWRAAAIAKIDEVPVVVRDIADDQVIKLQLVENKNRVDIHPLDEAEAMERLLKLNRLETPKTIAATIGMSERYVQNRLHYLRLVPDVKEAFRRDEITAGHVDLLMRLPPEEQTQAFKKGLHEDVFDYDDLYEKNTRRREVRSVRGLGDWIAGNVRLPLDAKSPQLELLPDVAQALTASTDGVTPSLVELMDGYGTWSGKGPAPLTRDKWAPLKANDKCDSQVRGVVVIGRRRGQILAVCTGIGVCKKHWAHTIQQPRPTSGGTTKKAAPVKKSPAAVKRERQLAERREREKSWTTLRPKAEKLIRERADKLKPADAYAAIGAALALALPKRPTLSQLVAAAVFEDRFYGPDDFEHVAPYFGIDVKKFYADAAAPKVPAPTKQQLADLRKQLKAKTKKPRRFDPMRKKKAAPKRKAGAKK